jgi:GT2 family glycosyltransferase
MKQLTIIIVSYNSKDFLIICLRSILASDIKYFDYEIIVVDNNSKDNTYKIIKQEFEGIKIIHSENYGFGHACNTGVAHSVGEFILFLNPDTYVTNNFGSQLFEIINSNFDNRTGSVGIKNLAFENNSYLPPKYKSLGINFFGRARIKQFGNHLFNSGSSVLYIKNFFVECGMYSSHIFLYNEDIDIGLRIFRMGYSHKIVESPEIYHYGSGITGRDWRKKVHWYSRGEFITIINNFHYLIPFMLFCHFFMYLLILFHFLLSGRYEEFKKLLQVYIDIFNTRKFIFTDRQLFSKRFKVSEFRLLNLF